MKGAVLYGPRDVRFEERSTPKIIEPTDAIIRMSATCVCGSDLWPYRGINPITQPTPMGHEYCGIVEEVGNAVTRIKPGQFVIGSFFTSDNTCPHCQAGYQSSCQHKEFVGTAQAPILCVPLADGTLVATPITTALLSGRCAARRQNARLQHLSRTQFPSTTMVQGEPPLWIVVSFLAQRSYDAVCVSAFTNRIVV